MKPLFHITTTAELEAARTTGEYRPQAFAREGFVHCSYREQVAATANRIFQGRAGLVLLEIDPRKLAAKVADENLEAGRELFPHVYGAIPLTAVRAAHDFPCDPEGRFTLPAAV